MFRKFMLVVAVMLGLAQGAVAQPVINSIVRSVDGGGYYVRVDANWCSEYSPYGYCGTGAAENQYFWFMDSVHIPAWDGQYKIYITNLASAYSVYVYASTNLNPNNLLSYANNYTGSSYIGNGKARINGCENFESGPARCMQPFMATASAATDWYWKISGSTNYELVVEEGDGDGWNFACTHLGVDDGRCKEYTVIAWNSANASWATTNKAYAVFWCMTGNNCLYSCYGGYTIHN